MLIREFSIADLERVDEIWREHHSHVASLPHRKNALAEAIAEEAGKVVGYGQVKAFAEAMMFLDMDISRISRGRALKGMIEKAIRETKAVGITDLYVFAKDPDFAIVLERHFDFQRVDDPGELLLRSL
jgi:hypothetical protein